MSPRGSAPLQQAAGVPAHTHLPARRTVVQVDGPESRPARPAGLHGAVGKGGTELEAVAQVVPAAPPSEIGARHLGGGRAAGAEGQRA